MIIVDLPKGKLGYDGTRPALMSDVVCILRELLRKECITEADIDFICQRAKKTVRDPFIDELHRENPEGLAALAQMMAIITGDENLMAAVRLYRELKDKENGKEPEDNQD